MLSAVVGPPSGKIAGGDSSGDGTGWHGALEGGAGSMSGGGLSGLGRQLVHRTYLGVQYS